MYNVVMTVVCVILLSWTVINQFSSGALDRWLINCVKELLSKALAAIYRREIKKFKKNIEVIPWEDLED